jgi:hypothetical protein
MNIYAPMLGVYCVHVFTNPKFSAMNRNVKEMRDA